MFSARAEKCASIFRVTHSDLCDRAVRWLYGTKRCNIVLSGIASTAEIPDAIGWSTSYSSYGSVIVECKMSVSDFHADRKKNSFWASADDDDYRYRRSRLSARDAAARGYCAKQRPRMGNRRYFLCPSGVIGSGLIEKYCPDHGLLHLAGRSVRVVCEAPERKDPDVAAENRLLQFALVHVRENLLTRGFTVDMTQLTKHWLTCKKAQYDGLSNST